MRKVFISHATVDKELAYLVQELIETGIGLKHDEVFCTSLEGLGIPEGTPDFKEYIRTEMQGCDTVVALISPNYYASPFCMCELGAVWVLAKNFFPILVSPVDFSDLRGALTGMQCRKLVDQTTASALYTRLSKLVSSPVPIERWDVKKEVFYRGLTAVLQKLPKPKTVKVEELDALRGERDRFKTLNVQLQEECDSLKRQNAELATAKDSEQVAGILKKYSSEWEQFESLRKACGSALKTLPKVIQEALFYRTRGTEFRPSVSEWDGEVQAALEDDLLIENPHEDYAFSVNSERPKIAKAIKSIEKLKQFLEEECSEQFLELAIEELGDRPDLKRRSFWEESLR
jgi:TIR domain